MGLFEQWPYVNFHDMNLDWVIKKIKNVETAEENSQASAEASAESAAASQLSADASQLSADASQTSAEASAYEVSRIEGKAEQIDINTARIDNILVSGTPTEGNAELIDIRVGGNGITYPTAGDSVRGQYDQVHDDIYYFSKVTDLTWTTGGISTSDGSDYTSANIKTGQISLISNHISILNTNDKRYNLYLFNSSNALLRTFVYTQVHEGDFELLPDTAYIRIMIESPSRDLSDAEGFLLSFYDDSLPGIREKYIRNDFTKANGYRPVQTYYGYITTNISVIDFNTYTAGTGYRHAIDTCSEGDLYIMKGSAAEAARLWCFTDADKNVLSVAISGADTQGEYIVVNAPENAAYFIFNGKTIMEPDVFKKEKAAGDIIYTRFADSDFKPGRYVPTTGVYQRNYSQFISLDEYVPDYVKSIHMDPGIKVCMNIWNRSTGSYQGNNYWNTNEKPFAFNQTAYRYKLYAGYADESIIVDPADVISKMHIACNAEQYTEAQNKKTKDITECKNEINALSIMINNLMKNTSYDISFANAGVPLSFKNCLGNTQNVHPKVLYFENGFGSHNYWMAYTPYPFSSDKYENPCIAYSDNGFEWTNISSNPLSDPAGVGYNSDTHLVYRSDTNTLECWYRYIGAESQTPREETIYRRTSVDGINWTAEEQLYSNTSGNYSQLLSPSVLFDGTKYMIWVVDNTIIKYYEAPGSNPASWSYIRSYSITFEDSGVAVNPWHIDVIKDVDTFVILAMCRQSTALGTPMSLFITTSQDNTTYSSPFKVVKGSKSWDAYMYRSSIVKIGNKYRIYYSATNGGTQTVYTGGAVWGIGITESDTLTTGYLGMLK